MKNQLTKFALAILVIGGVTVTATASAECQGCVPPAPVYNTGTAGTFNIEGKGYSSGGFMGQFSGDAGKVSGIKIGESGTNVKLEGAGSGCTFNCNSFKWTGSSFGSEYSAVEVAASGKTPGKAVMGMNATEARAGAALNFGNSFQMPAPRPW